MLRAESYRAGEFEFASPPGGDRNEQWMPTTMGGAAVIGRLVLKYILLQVVWAASHQSLLIEEVFSKHHDGAAQNEQRVQSSDPESAGLVRREAYNLGGRYVLNALPVKNLARKCELHKRLGDDRMGRCASPPNL